MVTVCWFPHFDAILTLWNRSNLGFPAILVMLFGISSLWCPFWLKLSIFMTLWVEFCLVLWVHSGGHWLYMSNKYGQLVQGISVLKLLCQWSQSTRHCEILQAGCEAITHNNIIKQTSIEDESCQRGWTCISQILQTSSTIARNDIRICMHFKQTMLC